MENVKEYTDTNKSRWEEKTDIHKDSEFYDLKGFMAGKQTLDPIELDEVGDVSGKELLHMQCHFGLDTLSWARLGADVVGVDFAENAIDLARDISKTSGVDGQFICSDIYDLPEHLDGEYDIVFTSGGVLCWLSDLQKWAEIIVHFLRPGGFFYIREFHPVSYIFENEGDVEDLVVDYPYFHSRQPLKIETEGTYADTSAKTEHKTSYEWAHPISEILNSLISVGLHIDFFNEFPYTTWKQFPFMVKRENGRYELPEKKDCVPLMFSIKATKES